MLRRVASLLSDALRSKEDFVARYGGDEFVIVLPDTAHEALLRVAERMREVIDLARAPQVEGSIGQKTAGADDQLWGCDGVADECGRCDIAGGGGGCGAVPGEGQWDETRCARCGTSRVRISH